MKTYNLLENDKFAETINKQSRLIGIDHGKKNIGISICDENPRPPRPPLSAGPAVAAAGCRQEVCRHDRR